MPYTREQLQEAVESSVSIRQVMLKLGVDFKDTNKKHNVFKRRILKEGLDISHFKGQAANKGVSLPARQKPASSYFKELGSKRTISSDRLKKKIIKEGLLEHRCSSCKLDTWLDTAIPLELDHIDGNRKNNVFENLRLLCPNCHALTPTYRGKNIKNFGRVREQA